MSASVYSCVVRKRKFSTLSLHSAVENVSFCITSIHVSIVCGLSGCLNSLCRKLTDELTRAIYGVFVFMIWVSQQGEVITAMIGQANQQCPMVQAKTSQLILSLGNKLVENVKVCKAFIHFCCAMSGQNDKATLIMLCRAELEMPLLLFLLMATCCPPRVKKETNASRFAFVLVE